MIQFPVKEDLVNFTRIKHSETRITIPLSLIQERMIDGGGLTTRRIVVMLRTRHQKCALPQYRLSIT